MGLTIGQLAANAEVNVETIRFYERRGLIARPDKPTTGYRQYSKEVLHRLLFIRKAQTLGFKLDEIENLLFLSIGHCTEIQSLAEQKLAQVHDKINDLQRLEEALSDLVRQCNASVNKAHCPIVDSLLNDK
ncbi:MAG: MerR family mercuric resistance operon transcriptional regulator [Gammaproteobacteria bacterium]|jgi:MerR family mercuric resistance operon transcriptional regulator